jgi:hypothetical protein
MHAANAGVCFLQCDWSAPIQNPHACRVPGCVFPDVRHIGQLLSCAMQQSLSIFDLLDLPICHPAIEEGLRTVMRSVRRRFYTQQQSLLSSARDRLPLEGLD